MIKQKLIWVSGKGTWNTVCVLGGRGSVIWSVISQYFLQQFGPVFQCQPCTQSKTSLSIKPSPSWPILHWKYQRGQKVRVPRLVVQQLKGNSGDMLPGDVPFHLPQPPLPHPISVAMIVNIYIQLSHRMTTWCQQIYLFSSHSYLWIAGSGHVTRESQRGNEENTKAIMRSFIM